MTKQYNRKANKKQTEALLYLKQGGTKADALRKAGYSEATVKTPSKVFDSRGVRNLEAEMRGELIKVAPPDKIAKKLASYLDMEEVVLKPMDGGGFEAVPTGQPHKDTLRAIQEMNKMLGVYAPDKKVVANITIDDLLEDQ